MFNFNRKDSLKTNTYLKESINNEILPPIIESIIFTK